MRKVTPFLDWILEHGKMMKMSKKEWFKLYALKHLKTRLNSRLSSSTTKMSPLVFVASFRALSRGFEVFFGRSVSRVYRDTRDTDLKELEGSLWKKLFVRFFCSKIFFSLSLRPFLFTSLHKDGEISKRSLYFLNAFIINSLWRKFFGAKTSKRFYLSYVIIVLPRLFSTTPRE